MTKFDNSDRAFLGGMIYGWAAVIKTGDQKEIERVVKDMEEYAKFLALSAGAEVD